MDEKPLDQYIGRSREGFSAATEDAVRTAEQEGRLHPPVTLRVTEFEVDVEGPIGEYRVVLSSGG